MIVRLEGDEKCIAKHGWVEVDLESPGYHTLTSCLVMTREQAEEMLSAFSARLDEPSAIEMEAVKTGEIVWLPKDKKHKIAEGKVGVCPLGAGGGLFVAFGKFVLSPMHATRLHFSLSERLKEKQ